VARTLCRRLEEFVVNREPYDLGRPLQLVSCFCLDLLMVREDHHPIRRWHDDIEHLVPRAPASSIQLEHDQLGFVTGPVSHEADDQRPAFKSTADRIDLAFGQQDPHRA